MITNAIDTGGPITIAMVAAAVLETPGQGVDWQPGDGSRYELYRVSASAPRRVDGDTGSLGHTDLLVCSNLGLVISLRGLWNRSTWATVIKTPGCWSGLRPLLFAMGHAVGTVDYRQRDAIDEAEERAHHHTAQTIDRGDAELGRVVRLLAAEHAVRETQR